MRIIRLPLFVLSTISFALIGFSSTRGNEIEAVKGKQYKLTKRHGPWMIMVASINRPPEDRRGEGLTPEQAADELVYELRLKGIPAYTKRQEEKVDDGVVTLSRRTQAERAGKVRTQNEGICVLAGNYPSSDDPVAQKTLKYLKKFQPRLLSDVDAQGEVSKESFIKRLKNGGIYRTTPSRPGPLSGAFMTTNPELNEREVAARTRDPLLLQLNSGNEYSLLQNKGKYTVVVATFLGKSHTVVGHPVDDRKLEISTALDDAAARAWELCGALRHAKSLGYDQEFETYVYHDRFSSIVTVGSFQQENDPRIKDLQNKFGAKVAAVNPDGSPAIGAEVFAIPKKAKGKEPVKTWIFDPFPRMIPVPR